MHPGLGLLLLASLVVSQRAWGPCSTSSLAGCWVPALLLVTLPVALALGYARGVGVARGAAGDSAEFSRPRLATARLRLQVLWLAATLLVFLTGVWPCCVATIAPGDPPGVVWALASMAAVLLPLGGVWIAWGMVEETVASAAPIAGSALFMLGLRGAIWRLRQQVGLIVAPVLAVLALDDLARWTMGSAGRLGVVAYTTVGCAGLLVFFPCAVRWLWVTRPLPHGLLRQRLEQLAHQGGSPISQWLLWHSDGRIVNAAVVGFLPWPRYVLISDGLLSRLTPDELALVCAHELGHVRHRHAWVRVGVMAAPASLWAVLCAVLPAAPVWLEQNLVVVGDGPGAIALALAGMTLWAGTVFAYVARRLEWQADDFACRLLAAEEAPGESDWVADTARRYAQVLEKMARANGLAVSRRTWQHGRLSDRIARLRAWPDGAPELAGSPVGRLSVATAGLTAAGLAAVIGQSLG